MYKKTDKKTKRKRGSDDRRTWIEKVDRVFSLYIRLRDSKQFHFRKFRCISCGQPKDFDQMDAGHFISRNCMPLRYNEMNVNGECAHCLTPDALILMEDLTEKPLGEVQVMDKIFSIEEYPTNGKPREYCVGAVTHIHREIQDVYEVTLFNGDKIKTTAEHKWLTSGKGCGCGYQWVETQNLYVSENNSQGNVVDKIFIENWDNGQLSIKNHLNVTEVKYIGKQEVVVMETDTHTFIANGYAMHNCNRMQGDHLLGYRKNLIIKLGEDAISGSPLAQSLEPKKRMALIKKLGEQRVEALEAQKYESYKWSVEELKELYMYYGALVLELKNSI